MLVGRDLRRYATTEPHQGGEACKATDCHCERELLQQTRAVHPLGLSAATEIVNAHYTAVASDIFGASDGAPVHAIIGLLDGVAVARDGVETDGDIEANASD